MRRRILLSITACVGLAFAQSAALAQVTIDDLDLPAPGADIVAPGADVVPPSGFIPEGSAVAAPQGEFVDTGYPIGGPCSMIDVPPTPVPYPGIELWEGFCNHHDHLADLCSDGKPCAWGALDVLWLARGVGNDVTLAFNDAAAPVLGSSEFDFDHVGGVRLSYGRLVGCTPVEFTYFGGLDWASTIGIAGADGLFVPIDAFPNGAFSEADLVVAEYSTELDSFELNVLQYNGCNCSTVFAGVRFISIDEQFNLIALDGDDGLGALSMNTDNYLLGLQVGGALERTCGRLTFGASAKAGVYINFAEARYNFFENDAAAAGPIEVAASQDDNECAFVGEALFGASYCLGAGFSLRGGYQLTWINGLALAPEQFGNASAVSFAPVTFDVDGDTLYDGGYIGLAWQR